MILDQWILKSGNFEITIQKHSDKWTVSCNGTEWTEEKDSFSRVLLNRPDLMEFRGPHESVIVFSESDLACDVSPVTYVRVSEPRPDVPISRIDFPLLSEQIAYS